MESISPFRGIAGETVRQFVGISTLITAIPSLIAVMMLFLAMGFLLSLLHLPPVLFPTCLILASSPVLGRFAIGARNGDLQAGLFTADYSDGGVFVVRFAALTVAWCVPWSLLFFYGLLGRFDLLAAFSSAGAILLAVTALLMVVLAVLLVPICLLIATRAQSVPECFAAESWRWVLSDRVEDLVPLLAAYLGGMMLFALVLFPVVLLLAALAFSVSTSAAVLIGGFAYLSPAVAAPIILGRLAGAFVAADGADSPFFKQEKLVEVGPATTTAPMAVIPPRRDLHNNSLEVAKTVQQLGRRADLDPEGALREAETLRQSHPNHPALLALLCKFYQKAERNEDLVKTATHAIQQGFKSGATPIALEVFATVGGARKQLDLGAAGFGDLGRALLNGQLFDDALWAFRAGEVLGADSVQTQKAIIAVADAATKAGDLKRAVQYYEYFLRTYANSSFRDYCENALATLKRRV